VAQRKNQPSIEAGLKEQHHQVQLHQLEKSEVPEHKAGVCHKILLNNSKICPENLGLWTG
jgi:hypothetical protein